MACPALPAAPVRDMNRFMRHRHLPAALSRFAVAPFCLLALSACGADEGARAPGDGAATHAFNGIGPDETVRFTGTEPFWGGEEKDGRLTYSTPENQAGVAIAVRRFAGNAGLGFSGTLDGRPFDMTVTPGACSDGMSERSYPFTVTLRLGDEQRQGCAWTDRQPFSGPEAP